MPINRHISIAERTLGVADPDQPNAIQDAYCNVTGAELPTTADFAAECERLDRYDTKNEWGAIHINEQERITALNMLRQIFVERGIRYGSALQHWPAYEAMYAKANIDRDRQKQRVALQLGSYTAISTLAFSALAEDVYGATPLNVDLTVSPARARAGNHAVMDVFDLALPDESVDIAQSNFLMAMLRPPRDMNRIDQAHQLFAEVDRVLKPGGHLFLYEVASDLDATEHPHYSSDANQQRFADFKQEITGGLWRAGFSYIEMGHARQAVGIDYLFDPQRDFSQLETQERPATIAVIAQKSS
jgi:SAM-dependent methyltransferase